MKRLHVMATAIGTLGLLVAVALAAGCNGGTSGINTQSTAAGASVAEDATAQAEATLLEFFQAWAAKDETALGSLLGTQQQGITWQFEDLDRVEFGPAMEAPEQIDFYLTSGRGSVSSVTRDDVRCFRASVTFYYRPGTSAPVGSGDQQNWTWFLVRGSEGEWRVEDWGY